MITKNILHLSHTDLDGIGCQIASHNTFKNVRNFNSTYVKVTEFLHIIEEHIERNIYYYDYVFVTDLSITEEDFILLNKIANRYIDIEFIFIDHHPYVFDHSHYKESNLKIITTEKYSASLLTLKYLQKYFKTTNNSTKEINKIINNINAYDIWLVDKPEFNNGLILNELFWSFKLKPTFNKYKNYPHSLTNKDKELYGKLMNKKEILYAKSIENGRQFTFGKRIFVIFMDDFSSHITLDNPGYSTYIIVKSYGSMSVRIIEEYGVNGIMKDNIVNKLLKLDEVHSAGGHNLALGLSLVNKSVDNQFKVLKQLVNFIDIEMDIIDGI